VSARGCPSALAGPRAGLALALSDGPPVEQAVIPAGGLAGLVGLVAGERGGVTVAAADRLVTVGRGDALALAAAGKVDLRAQLERALPGGRAVGVAARRRGVVLLHVLLLR